MQLVEEVAFEDLHKIGGFGARTTPILVKGAVKTWPAWDRWSFDFLTTLRKPDGEDVFTEFQDGVVEQGKTNVYKVGPITPYFAELAEEARKPHPVDRGLLTAERFANLKPGDNFHLDWSYMQTFSPNKIYLSQWHLLEEFPELKKDFAMRDLWPGMRWTWEYVFIGPAQTVTGLHHDFPHNWFCQVRGTKEVLLFTPDQSKHLCKSTKYDWGATLSRIDITNLPGQPKESAEFAKAKGIYARVEPGDALFIPKRCWHMVVSLEPAISLAVFGLTPSEIILEGGYQEFWRILHAMGLYARGNCACNHDNPIRQAKTTKKKDDKKAEEPVQVKE